MRSKLIFLFIICIAVFLRFHNLGSVPAHPTIDEVSLGYNAYSILNTGKDEFGKDYPILLRAYDDYRPALYAYLIIPFLKIFDLSVLAVRFPAAILSSLAVLSSYFLVKELILKKEKRRQELALFVMFIFAISPWDVYISRLGHEANAGFAFFIFGLLFFLRYVNGEKLLKLQGIQLVLSAIFFALSFDSYQSEKLVVPIIVLSLCLMFSQKLLENKKALIISFLVGLMITVPIIYASMAPDALIRFQGTNVFKSQSPILTESIHRIEMNTGKENLFQKTFDNRRVGPILLFNQAFLSHFSPSWLITNSGRENFKIPDFGLLSIFEGALILFGILYILKTNNISKKIKIFIIVWVISSILPAAITTDYPHAMRVMTVIPLPQIVAGLGVIYLLDAFKKPRLIWGVILGLSVITTLWLYHAYFINFKREESYRFQYGVRESLNEAKIQEKNYDQIVISDQGVLRASYMYYLFFNKIDPKIYQVSGQNENGRFDTERKLGKYLFTNPGAKGVEGSPLFIIPAESMPEGNLKILKKIKNLEGNEVIWIGIKQSKH